MNSAVAADSWESSSSETTAASRVVFVVGATASGKTALAVDIAQRCHGEVINADAFQVYQHFVVGTGSPSAAERQGVTHHLFNYRDPQAPLSAADLAREAEEKITEIKARGRLPIVCGGSGLYVRVMLRGLCEAPGAVQSLRERHRLIQQARGTEALHQALQNVDAEAAARIGRNDFVRISRALEVFELTGKPISELQAAHRFEGRRAGAVLVGRRYPTEDLRRRVADRVAQLVARGWADEVRTLGENGLWTSPPMRAVGYAHMVAFVEGAIDEEELTRLIVRDTWRLARRQHNWFRREPDVFWLSGTEKLTCRQLDTLRLREVR